MVCRVFVRLLTPEYKNHILNLGPCFRKSDQRDGYHWFSRNLKGEDIHLMTHILAEFLHASCRRDLDGPQEGYGRLPPSAHSRVLQNPHI